MPDNIDPTVMARRLDGMDRNLSDLARSVTHLVQDIDKSKNVLDELRVDRALRVERDLRIAEQFTEVKAKINGIYKLGWWVLATFGAALIMLMVNFALRGGPLVPIVAN
jgi:hypothetical protein